MIKPEIQKAFEIMLKGKSIRLKKEARAKWNEVFPVSDTWFRIQSIHADESVTICGNNHTILEGETLENLHL